MYIHIFCIAEYWGTQNMYSSDHVFDLYIYIYARGCTFFDDVVSFVRTWMRFMICSMLLGTWVPPFVLI